MQIFEPFLHSLLWIVRKKTHNDHVLQKCNSLTNTLLVHFSPVVLICVYVLFSRVRGNGGIDVKLNCISAWSQFVFLRTYLSRKSSSTTNFPRGLILLFLKQEYVQCDGEVFAIEHLFSYISTSFHEKL